MPLPSLALIKEAFPAVEIIQEKHTFQNCLWRGAVASRALYIKAYTAAEHYAAERDTLVALEQNHQTANFRFPEILAADEELRVLMISEVSGRVLSATDHLSCVSQVATVLRSFHAERGCIHATRSDVAQLLHLYQTNIDTTDKFSPGERAVLTRALSRLRRSTNRLIGGQELIHGDMNLGNILYDPQDAVPFALIDFERVAIGNGLRDVAKFIWRVLGADPYYAQKLLGEYLGRVPSLQDQKDLQDALIFEYLGAVSYFAYRGYQENYPFKDDAINQLWQCC